MEHECSPEIMREHERRITEAEQSTSSAHLRINEVVALVKDFTLEMRVSNKTSAELLSEIKSLTKEISHIAVASAKHEGDISEIKENMETKDTVLALYKKIESSDTEYKKGLDAVMAALRQNEKDLNEHKLEPAKQALADRRAFQQMIFKYGFWLLGVIISGYVLLYLGLK